MRMQETDEERSHRQAMTFIKNRLTREVAIEDSLLMADDMGLEQVKVLDMDDLYDITDSADTSDIPFDQLKSFRRADLVVETTNPAGKICFIAVEVSFTANGRDIDRAVRNATFLTRFTGHSAYPAVAGMYKDDRIEQRLEAGKVFWHQLERSKLDLE